MDSMFLTKPTRLWKSKADFFRPFRSAASEARLEGLLESSPGHGVADAKDDTAEINNLNLALHTLVEVFPDVDPATFREMLSNISPESRVEIVTEQVLRKRGKASAPTTLQRMMQLARQSRTYEVEDTVKRRAPLQVEDTFRGERYHDAVRTLLHQEFKSLSHSTIRAVMAEKNGSYSRSRPVLQQLSSRTWRFSIASLWSKKIQVVNSVGHPALQWQHQDNLLGKAAPSVVPTGCAQLDAELQDLLVSPVLEQLCQDRLIADQSLAHQLNSAEAEAHKSTFDCECCYSSVTFEEIASCSSGEHLLCHECIRRSTEEALWGQGWARTADLDRASIRCFAPALQECSSSIPRHALQPALCGNLLKPHIWQEFQDRVSRESLLKSRIPLERCPKCTYAEVNIIPRMRLRGWEETTRLYSTFLKVMMYSELAIFVAAILGSFTVLFEATICIVLAPFGILWWLISAAISLYHRGGHQQQVSVWHNTFQQTSTILTTSIERLYKQRRGLKFWCQNIDCKKVSCLRCKSVWHDPHICFEDEKTSLRTTIEASATAAVKRTCPRCLLSFIKSSGCNKLVCNCGYTMCYICRSEITSKEGYGHFCQHFRPNGGRCRDCDRCDLYGDVDEEAAIRQAAVLAEQEWRQKEALKTRKQVTTTTETETTRAMIEAVLENNHRGRWYEDLLDSWLDARVVFVED